MVYSFQCNPSKELQQNELNKLKCIGWTKVVKWMWQLILYKDVKLPSIHLCRDTIKHCFGYLCNGISRWEYYLERETWWNKLPCLICMDFVQSTESIDRTKRLMERDSSPLTTGLVHWYVKSLYSNKNMNFAWIPRL